MKKSIFALLFVLCWIFILPVQAAIVTSLYQANVLVVSQSQDNWQNAIPEALTQVLIKVSGDSQIAQVGNIKSQLSQASSLVQSYSYINSPNANGQNNLMLQVQFDPQSVNKLLRQAGISLWSKQRPTTLIWLAVQTPHGQLLINNDPANIYGTVLQNAANQRGIPILLPIMDLQDMQNVSLANILQLDPTGAINAAKRYGANETLIGHVYRGSDGKWQGKILLVTNNAAPWEIESDDINQVLSAIIDKTTASLVANVDNNENFTPEQKQTLSLHISNVNGLDDYAAVVKYLRGLAPVTAVDVVNVNPSDLNVNVDVLGGVQALNDAVNSGTQMQVVAPPSPPQQPNTADATQPPVDNQNAELNYRWISGTNNATNNPVANIPATNNTVTVNNSTP